MEKGRQHDGPFELPFWAQGVKADLRLPVHPGTLPIQV